MNLGALKLSLILFGLSWLLRVEETQQGLRMLKRFTARLGPRRAAR